MVYGIAKMLNFAHGDVIMIGGFVVFTAISSSLTSPALAIICGIVVCTLLGVVIEKIAYKPLRNATPLAVLITAIGVSYLLQNIALLVFGSASKNFPDIFKNMPDWHVTEGLTVSGVTIITIVVTVIIMIGLTLFIQFTKPGTAMQAVSEDRGAAQLIGVSVNSTISLTFAIGSALAAVASVLLCSAYPLLNPYTGAMPGIKAFVAAVFGGIGSIPGAVIGAFIIGICENIIKGMELTVFSNAFTFVLLIVILMVKPTGLFGEKNIDKV